MKQKASVRKKALGLKAIVMRDARRAANIIKRDAKRGTRFWIVAAVTGLLSGLAAKLFVRAIEALTKFLYQTDDLDVLNFSDEVAFWLLILVPTVGGLVSGLILNKFTNDGRARSISHVIEAAALHKGEVETRAGLASAAASLVTLSSGGSAGQEGPVVHLGALIAKKISAWVGADGIKACELLACAAAGAVASSFNAPLAGIVFAFEVILLHYGVGAFAPITVAAISGTVIGRLFDGGNYAQLDVYFNALRFYEEIPAFVLLGVLCGFISYILMRAILDTDELATKWSERYGIPQWLRPAAVGLMLGLVATQFPHIIGVGYHATVEALKGSFGFVEVAIFAVIKIIAVALTIGGRMGGGVFSPSLMVGALTGLAFGLVATSIFPDNSGFAQLYALAGAAAVSASVLGAPLSTTLIILELSQDWQSTIAILASVSVSTALTNRLVDKSFFLTQLENRNVHIADGPQDYLLTTMSAKRIALDRDIPATERARLINMGAMLASDATLEMAMERFKRLGVEALLVYDKAHIRRKQDDEGEITMHLADDGAELVGVITYRSLLETYNSLLVAKLREEHA